MCANRLSLENEEKERAIKIDFTVYKKIKSNLLILIYLFFYSNTICSIPVYINTNGTFI